MKQIVLLLSVFILFACEQKEEENFEVSRDEYEFVEIQYKQQPEDYVALRTLVKKEYGCNNTWGASPYEMFIHLQDTITHSSLFSEPVPTAVFSRLLTGFDVGVPWVDPDGDKLILTPGRSLMGGWTFAPGELQTKVTSLNDSYKYTVQPQKNIRMRVLISSYEIAVTYVMTVRRKHDGKLFELEGKWKGCQNVHVKYDMIDLTTEGQ